MATFPITEDTRFLPAKSESAAERRRRAKRWNGIMEEHHFLRMLCLERKRTERSGNAFMLMLLSGPRVFQSAEGERAIRQIVNAVSLATRETDTIGWYEYGSTVAVLFPEIGQPENTSLIIGRVTSALQNALRLEQFDALNIVFRIFPNQEVEPDDEDIDLIFYPDASERHDSRRGERILKRGIDIIGGLVILTALWPVLLVIALLIRTTSKGPILFRQRRVGLHGSSFTFLKFR
ncbi:MAG TPA: sugar transferase, partial [Nitrososphaera sp.]|nr:sugar transferase [Nitrososphaera sp.]